MKINTKLFAGAALLAAGLGFAACSRLGENSVKIVSISPDTVANLTVGAAVDLEVAVSYVLKEKEGSISLVVEKQDNSSICALREKILRGRGTFTFKQRFTVPDTRAVSVSVPLFAGDAEKTEIVDHRLYGVEKKK